ncbi:MAG TPA: hypothetical protein VHT21_12400 [Stellaceae bacterium]|jgi:hypothetical protein|nr:hypothetical protein [Stellaceae bacterium]
MKTGGPFGEWDELDFLAAGGMLVMAGSLAALLVPRFRKIEVLFPIAMGAAMMAAAGFGARHSDYNPTGDREDEAATAPLR